MDVLIENRSHPRPGGIAFRRILLAAVVSVMLLFATGCPTEEKEDTRKRLQEDITSACSTYVRNWLAENEPDAEWSGKLTVLMYKPDQLHGTNEKTVRAVTGSYRRDDKEIAFLCAMDDGPGIKLYVSELPESREKAVIDGLCKNFPLPYHADGLQAGEDIYFPLWYTGEIPDTGNGIVSKVTYRVASKTGLEQKLLPADMTAEMLYQEMPDVPFEGLDEMSGDPQIIACQNAVRAYLDTAWRNRLSVEITLTEDSYLEHEREILSWMKSAGVFEAIFRSADGTDEHAIRQSDITEEMLRPEVRPGDTVEYDATYLGVVGYGEPETKKENIESFRYRFLIDGSEQIFAIDNSQLGPDGKPAYPVQNKLKEEYDYSISVRDGVILDVTEALSESDNMYEPFVSGVPGEKTVLNFIKTALMPVGTTLYVYGGGWDWQDEGSAIQARTIGVSPDWLRFFEIRDVSYTFRDVDDDPNKRDPKTSYYPFGGYNEYYYAGLDCSGYVGWTIYNTMNTESGKDGYVCSSTKMVKMLADKGWGDCSQELKNTKEEWSHPLRPGDVVSIKGHVWISLGTCEDGSILIVHSTNGFVSRTGQPGGGVAIGAIGTSKDCEAYKLADAYMAKYYPKWYQRYEVALSNPDKYLTFEGDTAGRFAWDTEAAGGLTDAEHVQEMTPAEVLKLCFGE